MAISPEEIIAQEFDKEMDRIIDKIFAKSQEFLVENNKIDTGNLLKSGNVQRKFLEKEITYTAPYADIIEFGRQPGTMPPSDALEKWVERKLGIKDPDKIKKVSFAIAMAIKQRGTQASPYITPAFEIVKAQENLESRSDV